MKNSLILEGVIYLVLRPLWITPLLDLQNSSYLTQPHLIIANYILSVHSVVLDMHSLMGCLEKSGTLCVIHDYFFILFLILRPGNNHVPSSKHTWKYLRCKRVVVYPSHCKKIIITDVEQIETKGSGQNKWTRGGPTLTKSGEAIQDTTNLLSLIEYMLLAWKFERGPSLFVCIWSLHIIQTNCTKAVQTFHQFFTVRDRWLFEGKRVVS